MAAWAWLAASDCWNAGHWPGIHSVHNLIFAEETIHRRFDKYVNTSDPDNPKTSTVCHWDVDGKWVWDAGERIYPRGSVGYERWARSETPHQHDLPQELMSPERKGVLAVFHQIVNKQKRPPACYFVVQDAARNRPTKRQCRCGRPTSPTNPAENVAAHAAEPEYGHDSGHDSETNDIVESDSSETSESESDQNQQGPPKRRSDEPSRYLLKKQDSMDAFQIALDNYDPSNVEKSGAIVPYSNGNALDEACMVGNDLASIKIQLKGLTSMLYSWDKVSFRLNYALVLNAFAYFDTIANTEGTDKYFVEWWDDMKNKKVWEVGARGRFRSDVHWREARDPIIKQFIQLTYGREDARKPKEIIRSLLFNGILFNEFPQIQFLPKIDFLSWSSTWGGLNRIGMRDKMVAKWGRTPT